MLKLNDNEKAALLVLNQSDEKAFYFRHISMEAGFNDVKLTRRVVRSLARKGLAQYVQGLFDEDGMVAGSGYMITREGERACKACEHCGESWQYGDSILCVDCQEEEETEEDHLSH